VRPGLGAGVSVEASVAMRGAVRGGGRWGTASGGGTRRTWRRRVPERRPTRRTGPRGTSRGRPRTRIRPTDGESARSGGPSWVRPGRPGFSRDRRSPDIAHRNGPMAPAQGASLRPPRLRR
jgi:hypothetical protein